MTQSLPEIVWTPAEESKVGETYHFSWGEGFHYHPRFGPPKPFTLHERWSAKLSRKVILLAAHRLDDCRVFCNKLSRWFELRADDLYFGKD